MFQDIVAVFEYCIENCNVPWNKIFQVLKLDKELNIIIMHYQ